MAWHTNALPLPNPLRVGGEAVGGPSSHVLRCLDGLGTFLFDQRTRPRTVNTLSPDEERVGESDSAKLAIVERMLAWHTNALPLPDPLRVGGEAVGTRDLRT